MYTYILSAIYDNTEREHQFYRTCSSFYLIYVIIVCEYQYIGVYHDNLRPVVTTYL